MSGTAGCGQLGEAGETRVATGALVEPFRARERSQQDRRLRRRRRRPLINRLGPLGRSQASTLHSGFSVSPSIQPSCRPHPRPRPPRPPPPLAALFKRNPLSTAITAMSHGGGPPSTHTGASNAQGPSLTLSRVAVAQPPASSSSSTSLHLKRPPQHPSRPHKPARHVHRGVPQPPPRLDRGRRQPPPALQAHLGPLDLDEQRAHRRRSARARALVRRPGRRRRRRGGRARRDARARRRDGGRGGKAAGAHGCERGGERRAGRWRGRRGDGRQHERRGPRGGRLAQHLRRQRASPFLPRDPLSLPRARQS